jgi:hypothetical protein
MWGHLASGIGSRTRTSKQRETTQKKIGIYTPGVWTEGPKARHARATWQSKTAKEYLEKNVSKEKSYKKTYKL